LIGLSPLPSSHPSGFQPTPVRSSTACYGGFNLLKGRSPRLRVYRHVQSALFRLAFATAPVLKTLTKHVTSNSPDHNAKGTQSPPYEGSYRLSAHGFRFYFTRHLACFSPFPHGTSALSVIKEYLGLEGGPPRFAQDYTCPALLGIPLGVVHNRLRGFHPLWQAIPRRFTLVSFIPCRGPTTPEEQAPRVWPFPRSLTATRRISVDFFSSGY
jgi:hypothetical protein